MEDLQFQVQQLRLHERVIEKIADETRSIMWKDVETMIETTFYHTDLAIIIYDEQTINSIQPEKEPIEDVECGAFFCLKVPAYATGTSVAQSFSFDSMSVHEFLSDTSGSNPQEEWQKELNEQPQCSTPRQALKNTATYDKSSLNELIDFDDVSIPHENDDTNIKENELSCLELFYQSRSIKVPVPDLMNSSLTTDRTAVIQMET